MAENKELAEEGMLFVGDKGKILGGFRSENPQLIPEAKMKAYRAANNIPEPTPPDPNAPPAPPVDIAPSENISYRKMRPPKYPPQAVREHHTGKCVLKVLIGVDGAPKEVTIEKSSGYRELDQSAVAAAKTWMFNPGRRDGQPYEGYALIPVDFNLTDL